MFIIKQILKDKDKRFYLYSWIAVFIAIPAFLVNLGVDVFIGDEAIRSLVAMEMMISGNYLVPSMTGDFYFAKPPLYNWILIFFIKLNGFVNEFIIRLPTVIFSFVFTYLIYIFNKKRFVDKKYAILLGFMFLTCGRMIFYDSFLGLIDIFFSLTTYCMIYLAYSFAEKKSYGYMYGTMYAFALIGFMLKGLPTFHFLVFTLLIVHYIFGEWRKLFSWQHILSLITMVGVIWFYFYLYNQYRDASQTFAPLVDQAARRTIARFGFWDTVSHIFTYPLENIYHFFPWSVLGFLVFRKDILSKIREDKYIEYMTLCFVANYIVYWISPEVYPRYILMLIPIVFTIWIYLYTDEVGKDNLRMTIVSYLFKIIVIITPIFILWNINHPGLKYVENSEMKTIILSILLILISILYFKDQPNRPIIFVIFIMMVRLSMDFLIFPPRSMSGDGTVFKDEAVRIADKYGPLKLYGSSRLYHLSACYITAKTNKIVNRTYDLDQSKYFIIDSTYRHYFHKIDSFPDGFACGTRWIIRGKE